MLTSYIFLYSSAGSRCADNRTVHWADRRLLFFDPRSADTGIRRDGDLLGRRIRSGTLGRHKERNNNDSRPSGSRVRISERYHRYNEALC